MLDHMECSHDVPVVRGRLVEECTEIPFYDAQTFALAFSNEQAILLDTHRLDSSGPQKVQPFSPAAAQIERWTRQTRGLDYRQIDA